MTITALGIDSDDGTCTETCRIMVIYHRRSAKNSTQRIGCYGYRTMFPVDKVFADSMSPTQISPFGTVWVVLIEQMIFSIFVNHSIGVVHPSVKRRKMIRRTKLLTITCVVGVGQLHLLATKYIFGRKIYMNRIICIQSEFQNDCFAREVWNVYGDKVIDFMKRKAHIEIFHLFVINDHVDVHIGRSIFDRQKQILLISINTHEAMSFSQITDW